jgi:hypothetical protein
MANTLRTIFIRAPQSSQRGGVRGDRGKTGILSKVERANTRIVVVLEYCGDTILHRYSPTGPEPQTTIPLILSSLIIKIAEIAL